MSGWRLVNGRYESFTVRVWARGDEIGRGEVMHVHSGESERFADLEVLSNFLARQVASHDGDASAPQLTAESHSNGHADQAPERQKEGDTTPAEDSQRAHMH